MEYKTPALVILSGGQDSTTCVHWAIEKGYDVSAITFDYNQRHKCEVEAAKKVAEIYGITNHEIVEVGPILKGSSPLTDHTKDLEQYPDIYSLPGGLENTFVPARNLLFLTVAANRAYTQDIHTLITGVCQEDYGGYPDCRAGFINLTSQALEEGLDTPMEIITPLMFRTKEDCCLYSWRLDRHKLYKALAFSHTAYDGSCPPTGNDHATLLRAKGFVLADIPDPLLVRLYVEGKLKELPDSKNYLPSKIHEASKRLAGLKGFEDYNS